MWISPLIGVLVGFALLNPLYGISLWDLAVVGWVERSDTHHPGIVQKVDASSFQLTFPAT
jgi:hypothetical protein